MPGLTVDALLFEALAGKKSVLRAQISSLSPRREETYCKIRTGGNDRTIGSQKLQFPARAWRQIK